MLKNIENEPKKVTFLFVYLEIKLEMTYLCSRFQIKSIDNQALLRFSVQNNVPRRNHFSTRRSRIVLTKNIVT